MNNFIPDLKIPWCNLIWFISCVPSTILFVISSFCVHVTQKRILKKIIKKNSSAEWLKNRCYSDRADINTYQKIQPSEYSEYNKSIDNIINGGQNILTAEPVTLLEPTSGSTAVSKLIPYTHSLQKEFILALNPWIAGLYLVRPRMFFGKQYWSISPSTRFNEQKKSCVPIGFASDTEYLSSSQRKFVSELLVVPEEISSIENGENFEYITLLFLLREKNLRFISVWHPSFLTILLDLLKIRYKSLIDNINTGDITVCRPEEPNLLRKIMAYNKPDPIRADELSILDFSNNDSLRKIWPHLQIISCWADGHSEKPVNKIRYFFPETLIQPKGLIATEGIVSFPFGGKNRRVCAIRSHFLEFIDCDTKSIHPAWDVKKGKKYAVLLTTGGGLYRYKLHDTVKIEGFFNRTPTISFVGKDNKISDLVGEKLNIKHIDAILDKLYKTFSSLSFTMLAPFIEDLNTGYVLYIQSDEYDITQLLSLGKFVEQELNGNYHYNHARNLSQLKPLRIFSITGDGNKQYIDYLTEKGYKRGDIKVMSLSTETEWHSIFKGQFIT